MVRSTRLVIVIKNIHTLWGRKRFFLPVTYSNGYNHRAITLGGAQNLFLGLYVLLPQNVKSFKAALKTQTLKKLNLN